jgi:hypothetical protein
MYQYLIIQELIDCQSLRPNQLLVLITLARFTDPDGSCFPSLETLTKRTGLSRSSVVRTLNQCVELNLIQRIEDKRVKSTRYQFTYLMEEPMRHSGTGVTVTPEGNRDNVISINKDSSNSTPCYRVTQTPILELFTSFYAAYPRKIAVGHARKAFFRAAKTYDPTLIVLAAEQFALATAQTEKRFIPHPTTWLNGERYLDDVEELSSQSNTSKLDELMTVETRQNKPKEISW